MTWWRRAQRINRHRAPPDGAYLRRMAGICGVGLILVGAGWSTTVAIPCEAYDLLPVQARGPGAASDLRQRQVAFLHRLRQADPRYQTIDKAVLNEQNELGVILNRHVEMDAVRPLLRTLLTQMAREFPRQDLTVIAYAPTQPPRPIGTARFNARTRKMTYIPAVPQ
jgi:hypothetical protein